MKKNSAGKTCFVAPWQVIPYNDLGALQAKLEADPNIVAFMVEPIQVARGG